MDLTEPVRQGSSMVNHLATADPTLPGSQRDTRTSFDELPAVRALPSARFPFHLSRLGIGFQCSAGQSRGASSVSGPGACMQLTGVVRPHPDGSRMALNMS